MRTIFIFLLILGPVILKAANPVYPAREQVLKDVKTQGVLGSIIQIYGSKLTWDQIKLEYKMFVNGGEKSEPSFYDYQSRVAQKIELPANDMTEIPLIATTPKNADGNYYEVEVKVVYTCYNGATSLGKWNWVESKENGYYQRGGNASAAQKKVEEVINVFRQYKGENATQGEIKFYMWNDQEKIVGIDSIWANPAWQDDIMTWQKTTYFLAKLKLAKFEDDNFLMTSIGEGQCEVEVRWERKEVGNPWKIVSITLVRIRPTSTKEIPEDAPENKSNKRLCILDDCGFDAVYKKSTYYDRSFYTLPDLRNFLNEIETAIKTLGTDEAAGKSMMQNLLSPGINKEQYLNQILEPIRLALKYQCEISGVRCNTNIWKDSDKKINNENLEAYVSINRAWCGNDKKKMKAYKDAGVSKETIMKNGGQLNTQFKIALHVTFDLNANRWYFAPVAEPIEEKLD